MKLLITIGIIIINIIIIVIIIIIMMIMIIMIIMMIIISISRFRESLPTMGLEFESTKTLESSK